MRESRMREGRRKDRRERGTIETRLLRRERRKEQAISQRQPRQRVSGEREEKERETERREKKSERERKRGRKHERIRMVTINL